MSDIAVSPTNQLYGVDNNNNGDLFEIDPHTAATTEIGQLGAFVNSLVFSPDGTLYGANQSLFKIDTSTGAATAIGSLGGAVSGGDLAFDASGDLFLATTDGELDQVNPSTGAATAVGPLGFRDVWGLAFGSDGAMYGLSNLTNQVIVINLATGAGTWVSTMGGVNGADGADAAPAALLPKTPANVRATETSDTGPVHVTWDASYGAASYEIWQNAVDDPGSAIRLASGVTATSYDDFSEAAGSTNYYWIKADNQFAVTNFSAPAVSTPGEVSTIDLRPLQLSGKFVNNTATGTIDFAYGSLPLLEVDGTVSYDQTTINATGLVKSLGGLGGKSIFDGTFSIAVGQASTSLLGDTGPDSDQLHVAGADATFTAFTLTPSGVELNGAVVLPADLGGVPLPLSGENKLVISAGGLSLGLSVALPDLQLTLFNQLNVTASGIAVAYSQSSDQLTLQGKIAFGIAGRTVSGDFSGDHSITISPSGVLLNGNIAASGIDLPLIPGVLTLDGFDFGYDAVTRQLSLGLSLMAGTTEISADAEYLNFNVNSFSINASKLNVALPDGLYLQSLGGSVDHLSDSQPLVLSGAVGLTFGPELTLPLPPVLGGPVSGALISIDGQATIDFTGDLELSGKISIGGDAAASTGLATGSISLKLNFNAGSFNLPVQLQAFGGTFTFNGNIAGNATLGSLDGYGTATTQVFGIPIGSASAVFHYDTGARSDDYFEAWATVGLYPFARTVGRRIDFDGSSSWIGASALPQALAATEIVRRVGAFRAAPSTPPGVSQGFTVAARTAGILLIADWQNAQPGVQVEVQAPNGKIYIPGSSEHGSAPSLVTQLSGDGQEAIEIRSPAAGNWRVGVSSESGSSAMSFAGFSLLASPTAKIVSPHVSVESGSILVRYIATDSVAGATVSLFADNAASGFSGVPIATSLTVGAKTFTWNPSAMSDGDYHLYMEVSDPQTVPALVYGRGVIHRGTPNVMASIAKSAVTAKANAFGTALVRVVNLGTGTADANATVSLFLSSDATLDSTDISLAILGPARRMLRLKPGAAASFPIRYRFPSGVAGPMYLIASVTYE